MESKDISGKIIKDNANYILQFLANKEEQQESRADFFDSALGKKLGLHQRSITPTTFDGIQFSETTDDLWYQEHYSYGDSSVRRFGINIHNEISHEKLNEELEQHNKTLQKEILETQEN